LSFDPVHDPQAVHRALVRAFSYPGIPVSVKDPASRVPDNTLPSALTVVALTLLDAETSYFGDGAEVLGELTGASSVPLNEALFVFVPQWDEGQWCHSLGLAARGTLADPHRGATVVAFASSQEPGRVWSATGPGIEKPLRLFLPGTGAWVAARDQACREFPLGVDLLWVQESAVLALPLNHQTHPG